MHCDESAQEPPSPTTSAGSVQAVFPTGGYPTKPERHDPQVFGNDEQGALLSAEQLKGVEQFVVDASAAVAWITLSDSAPLRLWSWPMIVEARTAASAMGATVSTVAADSD
jgi:hypothetical protein